MTAAEEWANDGLGSLMEDLDRHVGPISMEDARIFMRAAYGAGYVNALRSDDHVFLLDVLSHRAELALRVPVS